MHCITGMVEAFNMVALKNRKAQQSDRFTEFPVVTQQPPYCLFMYMSNTALNDKDGSILIRSMALYIFVKNPISTLWMKI